MQQAIYADDHELSCQRQTAASAHAGTRRHGIVSALLRQVEAEALTGGIRNIALETWTANGSARSFFEACAFTPFNLSVRKQLAE